LPLRPYKEASGSPFSRESQSFVEAYRIPVLFFSASVNPGGCALLAGGPPSGGPPLSGMSPLSTPQPAMTTAKTRIRRPAA